MDYSIDIETFSSVDIKKSGLFKYAQSPDFEILLIAYADGVNPPKLIDLASGESARDFIRILMDENNYFSAYNAAFEWYCLSVWLKRLGLIADAGSMDLLRHFRCTMAKGMYLSYPAGLGAVCDAVGLAQDKKKMSVGLSLIRLFCVPQKPTKANGFRTRVLPHHEPEKWQLFKDYCKRDVIAEQAIDCALRDFAMPESELALWRLDVDMNAYGVLTDAELIEGALYMGETVRNDLVQEAQELSGLDNPNSVKQLIAWLNKELEDEREEEISSLTKADVNQLMKDGITSQAAARILEIRQSLGKTSTKKYDAMQNASGRDNRVRGLMQYYGASRTGRWAGRLVQVQNLPRNYLSTLDLARDLVIARKLGTLELLYGNIPDVLSQLIRTAFIPGNSKMFIVADYSAIEARVVAWLAKERWVMDVFAGHGKIYEATASQMFGVPIEKIAKGQPEYALRQRGKVATLALGYGGGEGALVAMGALNMGLIKDELPDIKQRWRSANPHIVESWRLLEIAAIQCVQTGCDSYALGLCFRMESSRDGRLRFLSLQLPSGRKLYYAQPQLIDGNFGKPALHYLGQSQGAKKMGLISTWGGKLVENAVQAIARDCLAHLLTLCQQRGWRVVFHVHDEIIIESETDILRDVLDAMKAPIPWAPDLILKGDGFTATDYYRKD